MTAAHLWPTSDQSGNPSRLQDTEIRNYKSLVGNSYSAGVGDSARILLVTGARNWPTSNHSGNLR